jgi:hypothetical protein
MKWEDIVAILMTAVILVAILILGIKAKVVHGEELTGITENSLVDNAVAQMKECYFLALKPS